MFINMMKKLKKLSCLLMAAVLISGFRFRISASAEPLEDGYQGRVYLTIDSDICYKGMDKSYSEGYVPTVEAGRANVIIPLISKNGSLKDDIMQISVNLGDTYTAPFVTKNYCKRVKPETITDADGSKKEIYPVNLYLELKENRVNGSYPVELIVSAEDTAGRSIEQKFKVYVTITDGSDLAENNSNSNLDDNYDNYNVVQSSDTNSTTEDVKADTTSDGQDKDNGDSGDFASTVDVSGAYDIASYQDVSSQNSSETVTFTPKVTVEACQADEERIYAGDEVKLTITLRNTSKTEKLRNMSIKVTSPDNYFTLLDASDNVYIDSFPADDTMDITFSYRINPITAKGQYSLTLDMDYADTKGNTYSQSGTARVDIYQNMDVSFDELNIAREAKVGEKIDASLNAINLGKTTVYNVRAVVWCDGLKSSGTLFIGDIEPGNMGSASTGITVCSLSGDELYGDTKGTVTCIYEDEEGNEFTETEEFDFTVNTPFTQQEEETQDEIGQWWIIMGVIAGIFSSLLIGMMKKYFAKRHK